MVYAYIITFLYFNPFLMLCPHRSYVFSLDSALQVLYLSLFSPYCPPVCMPASGCQPTRPPGQFFQPVPLVQRHQHRQGGSRGHFLFLLLRHICSERRPHIDPLFVCGHVPGNGACFSDHNATCWGATATAASYYFTCRCVVSFQKHSLSYKYESGCLLHDMKLYILTFMATVAQEVERVVQ